MKLFESVYTLTDVSAWDFSWVIRGVHAGGVGRTSAVLIPSRNWRKIACTFSALYLQIAISLVLRINRSLFPLYLEGGLHTLPWVV